MKPRYNAADAGYVSVNNEVIKNIALKAATEVDGIHEIKHGYMIRMWSSVTKKNTVQGVKLDFANDSEVAITLKLNIEYGVNISEAAGTVQECVKKAVEHMTGLTVTDVAVKITNMYAKDDAQKKNLK